MAAKRFRRRKKQCQQFDGYDQPKHPQPLFLVFGRDEKIESYLVSQIGRLMADILCDWLDLVDT